MPAWGRKNGGLNVQICCSMGVRPIQETSQARDGGHPPPRVRARRTFLYTGEVCHAENDCLARFVHRSHADIRHLSRGRKHECLNNHGSYVLRLQQRLRAIGLSFFPGEGLLHRCRSAP